MKFATRRPRKARRPLIATLASAALIAGAIAVPAAASAAVSASADLGATPTYQGVDGAWPGDADKIPAHAATTVAGRECWTMSGTPFNSYLYVNVSDSAKPANAKRALVTVDYYDAGQTNMEIQYDARLTPWQPTANLALKGSGTWKTAQFELADIRFANRSNGADFRINVKAGPETIPPLCFSRIEVTFTDAPVLDITSPSLLFKEGTGPITFATAADSIAYTIGDADGAPLRSGTIPVSATAGSLDISDLGPGYYTLTATADSGSPVTRTTSFGVVTPTPTGALSPDTSFGVGMHYGWQPVAVEDELLKSMALVGWGTTRSDINWASVETTAGAYDFASYAFDRGARRAKQLGITSMGNLGFRNPLYDANKTPSSTAGIQAFTDFAVAGTSFYSSITHDMGVLNEYNGTGFNDGTCGISAACYIKILKSLYPAVKAADPSVNVLGPTTAGTALAWAQDFVAQDGLKYIDTYSANVYGAPEATFASGEFLQLVDLIKQNQGAKNIPIWVTENGVYTSTNGVSESEQADWIVRSQVLAKSAGADKLIIYDAIDDGTDITNGEHNFGQFRRPTAGVTGISPKPAALASAVLIRETLGRTLQTREAIGDSAAYSYPYTGGSETVRVLWSTAPKTVRIATTAPLTVTDQLGAALTLHPQDGAVYLDLDGSPLYLHGDPTSIAVAAPLLKATAPQQSVIGATLPVTVTSDGAAGLPASIGVAVSGASGTLTPSAAGTATVTVSAPAVTSVGTRDLTVKASNGAGVFALLRTHSKLVEPMTVTARPVIVASSSGYASALDITVTNNDQGAALTLTGLSWRVGVWSGSSGTPVVVSAGSKKTVQVAVPDAARYVGYPFSAAVFTGTGDATDGGSLSWSPIEPDGATAYPPIPLDDLGKWVSLRGGTRTGTADLGGTVKFTYSPTALIAKAVITDDVHNANRTDPAQAWQVDSIQYDIYQAFPSVAGAARVEITSALLPSGPVVYTSAAPPGGAVGPTPGGTASIARDDTAGTTTYTVTVPWTALGYPQPPTEPFGLSFLVNDADASTASDARDGYIEWGSGVGASPKNPAQFRTAQIVPALP